MNAVDLFCGAGGTSIGAEMTGGVKVRFALNHWDRAISTHSANFPHAKHVNSRIEAVSPSEADPFNLFFASPECTHHSRARGGRPTGDQQRAGAWYTLPWIEHHRPQWAVFENVVEFREWGPVGPNGQPLKSKRGHFFDAWTGALKAAGYRVDHCELNAADFGAATSRNRLFVIARKGNRNPVFPEPTHAKHAANALPGMGLSPWRAAAEVIDWSLPCPSIFSRSRPLADKTLLRIEAGLRKFVGPFVTRYHGGVDSSNRSGSPESPLPVIDTSNRYGLVAPFQVLLRNNMDCAATEDPLRTVTAGGGHHGLAFALSTGSGGSPRTVGQPLPTIVTIDGTSLTIPWLDQYYGNGTQSAVSSPVNTITTKDRHAVCIARVGLHDDSHASHSPAMRKLRDTMRELGVCDIGFRMLQNHELSAAQGFPESYIFCGTKSDITKQIGNSVSPPVAQAITQTILGA